jgi:transposase-like protein
MILHSPVLWGFKSPPIASSNTQPYALQCMGLGLHRFRGLFKTENNPRKGEHCNEHTRPTRRSFAEKLSGWLEPPTRSIPGIARKIGVSDGTLRNWVNQEENRLRPARRAHKAGEGGTQETPARGEDPPPGESDLKKSRSSSSSSARCTNAGDSIYRGSA